MRRGDHFLRFKREGKEERAMAEEYERRLRGFRKKELKHSRSVAVFYSISDKLFLKRL